MATIKVRKQIIKNNQLQGYQEIEVAKEIADEQLALPKEKRHPHWRSVEYITDPVAGSSKSGSGQDDPEKSAREEYKQIFGKGAGNKKLETILQEIEEYKASQSADEPEGEGDFGNDE